MRPHFRLCRRAKHHGRDLDKGLIILGKLESGVFECLAKIVELGKVNVARAARSAVLAGESRNCVTVLGQQYDCYDCDESKEQRNPKPRNHFIASLAVQVVSRSHRFLRCEMRDIIVAGFDPCSVNCH